MLPVRKALEDARATLAACLAMNGASPGKGVFKPRRAAATRSAAAVDPRAVLTYVRNNPGSSGEQIADDGDGYGDAAASAARDDRSRRGQSLE